MGLMDQMGFDLTVKLPRYVVIHNNPLALLHKALIVFIIFIILYLAYSTNKYLKVVVPQGYPHMWTEQSSDYAALITTQSTSEWCSEGTRRAYDYYWSAGWTYTDITCADPSHWGEGAIYAPEGTAYFPTYWEESWTEKKTGETDCTALASSCTSHGNCGTATAVPPGEVCFTDRPGGSATDEGVCSCVRQKKDMFVLGTEQMKLLMSHMFTLTRDDGVRVDGYSTLKEAEVGTNGTPLRTIIQTYDEGAGQWKESDCGGVERTAEGGTNVAGQCRFDPGATISLTVEQWLSAAGISSLDDSNTSVRKNLQAGQTVTVDVTDYTLKDYPPLRLSGVQIILQIEYMDPYFHDEDEFEGTVCYIKVTANRSWTGRPEVRYEGALPQDGAVSGKVRKRYYEGVFFSIINSEMSSFGWPDPIQFMNYIAVMVVFLQIATYTILFISLYLLGNTSRNYQRVQREKVNASEAASREFPTRMMMAAVTFFQLAHLERLGPEADNIVPGFSEIRHQQMEDVSAIDNMTVSKKTVERMLRAAFSSVDDITEEDVLMMLESVWKEMSGDDDAVHLVEFLELATSNEYVDYIAVKRAFDQDRPVGCFERFLGDNVIVEEQKNGPMMKLMNFLTSFGGLLEDDDDDKEGDDLRNKLKQKMAMRKAGTKNLEEFLKEKKANQKSRAKVVPTHSASSSSFSSESSGGSEVRNRGWLGQAKARLGF